MFIIQPDTDDSSVMNHHWWSNGLLRGFRLLGFSIKFSFSKSFRNHFSKSFRNHSKSFRISKNENQIRKEFRVSKNENQRQETELRRNGEWGFSNEIKWFQFAWKYWKRKGNLVNYSAICLTVALNLGKSVPNGSTSKIAIRAEMIMIV